MDIKQQSCITLPPADNCITTQLFLFLKYVSYVVFIYNYNAWNFLLFTGQSVYLCVHLPVCIFLSGPLFSLFLSACLHLPVYLPTCLFICLSVTLSVSLSVCIPVCIGLTVYI